MKSAVNITTGEYFVVMVCFGNSWKRSKLAGQEDHDGEIMAGECPCRLKFFSYLPMFLCVSALLTRSEVNNNTEEYSVAMVSLRDSFKRMKKSMASD